MSCAATIQAGDSAAWLTELARDGIDPPPGLSSIYVQAESLPEIYQKLRYTQPRATSSPNPGQGLLPA